MKIDPGLIDMIMALRSQGISDNSVLRAIEQSPRRNFVDIGFRKETYAFQDLPIACGQSISSPLTVAMMTQLLEVDRAHKVLEIGTGSGFHTAILARVAKRVYSVERYRQLIADAEVRFKALEIFNIVVRHGDGRYGWGGQAPFDRILVTCALRAAPDMLLDQLAPDGIMIAVIDEQLTRITKARTKTKSETLMPLSLPMIEAGKSKVL